MPITAMLIGTAIQKTSQKAVTTMLSGVLWVPKRPPRIAATAITNSSQPGQLGPRGTGGTSSPTGCCRVTGRRSTSRKETKTTAPAPSRNR
ncbi:MAG: hypothetical protein E6I37_14250 [Chloroflexi bacterium]|nr:MAG: hypothetical protein E6I37_14250 [Chloroflexota bacterium]